MTTHDAPGPLRRTRPDVAGVGTPLLEAGPADATEAVVFLHGSPGSGEEFARLVERTGTSRRAIAPDMPGFGRADKPRDFDHSVEGYARHLEALLDALGIEHVHLVLHDLGGPWALRWTADRPERVRSVALMNAGGMPDFRWHRMARLWRTPVVGELLMAATTRTAFGLSLREGNPTPLPRHEIDRMYRNFDAATRHAVLRLYRATDPEAYDWLEPVLRGLDLPALVLWGEADPYVSLADAQRFTRLFPRARFVRIADSGHWPHLSTPGPVERTLDEWIGSVG
jgi:pimeloyl-ACP methyl ester carboxylesterase